MSMTEETSNEAAYRRFLDVINSLQMDAIDAAIEESFHPEATMGPVSGRASVKELFRTLHRAYPDLKIVAEDVIAKGDRVVCRQTVFGTHEGEYLGAPASGKALTWSEIFILRFADGQVVEAWGVVDVAAQMRQLGLIR